MTVIRRQRRAKERKVATAFKLDRSLLDKLAEFAEARGKAQHLSFPRVARLSQ